MTRSVAVVVTAFLWVSSVATADVVEDAIHVFYDEREDASGTVYVSLLGDYGLRMDQYAAFDEISHQHLNALMAYLNEKSVVIGNFEYVYPEELPETLQHFRDLGIDYMARANNHVGDHGDDLNHTLEAALKEIGVVPFGQKTMPQIEFERSGQRFVVLNATANTNHPSDYPLSIYDDNFQAVFRRFMSMAADVHIYYSHEGDPFSFITKRERHNALEYMEAGCDAVVFAANHTAKGYFWHDGRLAVISPGDFLFPDSGREMLYTPTYVPVLGFEKGRLVSFEAIVIDHKPPGYFRLADATLREELIAHVLEVSAADAKAAYTEEGMGSFIVEQIPNIFDRDYIRRLRWKHVELVCWYIYYNLLPHVFVTALLATTAIVLIVRRRRRRRAVQE